MRSKTSARVGLKLGALLGMVSAPLAMPLGAWAGTEMGTSSGAMMPADVAHGKVHIVSCSVSRLEANVARTSDGTDPTPVQTTSGIRVAFINRAGTAADSVGFLVSYGGEQHRIVDTGHFAPGITIEHTLPTIAGIPFQGEAPDSCTIASVHFEDGTTSP